MYCVTGGVDTTRVLPGGCTADVVAGLWMVVAGLWMVVSGTVDLCGVCCWFDCCVERAPGIANGVAGYRNLN